MLAVLRKIRFPGQEVSWTTLALPSGLIRSTSTGTALAAAAKLTTSVLGFARAMEVTRLRKQVTLLAAEAVSHRVHTCDPW
mmetsp:Transcript_15824/g.34923  ORF Transcript_15824/g.34923 Transcript_15824/m.34923 type:complete len:81 (+) Transcript_15824:823-1065(+)